MNLYQEHIMDHYRNPRNRGKLVNPDLAGEFHNPSCGDSISIQLELDGSTVSVIKFFGNGCVISQATASMLTQLVLTKSIHEIKTLNAQAIKDLIGIDLGPTRFKCAMLSLDALHQTLCEKSEK
jgi:nitrogen fixation protein NifU and related proteins